MEKELLIENPWFWNVIIAGVVYITETRYSFKLKVKTMSFKDYIEKGYRNNYKSILVQDKDGDFFTTHYETYFNSFIPSYECAAEQVCYIDYEDDIIIGVITDVKRADGGYIPITRHSIYKNKALMDA